MQETLQTEEQLDYHYQSSQLIVPQLRVESVSAPLLCFLSASDHPSFYLLCFKISLCILSGEPPWYPQLLTTPVCAVTTFPISRLQLSGWQLSWKVQDQTHHLSHPLTYHPLWVLLQVNITTIGLVSPSVSSMVTLTSSIFLPSTSKLVTKCYRLCFSTISWDCFIFSIPMAFDQD